MRATASVLISWLAMPVCAELSFEFPGQSTSTFFEEREFAAHNLPIGPYGDGEIETLIAEGSLSRAVWRISNSNGSSLSVTDALRQQAEQMGFELLFECEAQKCGGFDFRFGIDVVSEPKMHVDLGDFRYFSAQRLGSAVPEYVSFLVSRSADFAYVQLTRIGARDTASITLNSTEPEEEARQVIATAQPRQATKPGTIAAQLEETGSVALDDLVFATGSSQLGEREFPSLAELATFLEERPGTRIVLVGHTDAVGSLEPNIALSRRRATSVRSRLISRFSIPRERVSADGVGFLTPRASNATEEGRALNRRVEAVLATVN